MTNNKQIAAQFRCPTPNTIVVHINGQQAVAVPMDQIKHTLSPEWMRLIPTDGSEKELHVMGRTLARLEAMAHGQRFAERQAASVREGDTVAVMKRAKEGLSVRVGDKARILDAATAQRILPRPVFAAVRNRVVDTQIPVWGEARRALEYALNGEEAPAAKEWVATSDTGKVQALHEGQKIVLGSYA